MSVLTRGTFEEKVSYVFELYDILGHKMITRDEIDHFLRSCMSSSFGAGGLDVEELADAIKDIGDIIFRKLDVDHNSVITPDDFKEGKRLLRRI